MGPTKQFLLILLVAQLSTSSPWSPQLSPSKNFSTKFETETCGPNSASYFKFLSKTAASIQTPQQTVEYTTPCFENVQISWEFTTSNSVTLTMVSNSKKTWTCSDTYLISVGTQHQPNINFWSGKHYWYFNNLTDIDRQIIHIRGVYAFLLCDNILHLLPDLAKTLKLFLGDLFEASNAPRYDWEIRENINFMKETMGYTWKQRQPQKHYIPEKSSIKNGDVFVQQTFSGFGGMISYGTGSLIEHVVVSVWDDQENELYILESTRSGNSANNGYNKKAGVIKTKYQEWLDYNLNDKILVAYLPIKRNLSQKFDAKKAWEFFEDRKHLPYGLVSILYSYIDTPYDNYGPFYDIEFSYSLWMMFEDKGITAPLSIVTEPQNKRLGTKNLNMREILIEADKQGYSLAELMAVPEKDGWVYESGEAWVCSSFVVGVWKSAGLFEGFDVQATEFTPRDLYQLEFFDGDNIEKACKEKDPELGYCQVSGGYLFELPGFNSIKPYEKMNERCGGHAPDYKRENGC